MAKETKGWIELTSTQRVGHLKERGPVVPVMSFGRLQGYLQDGRWLSARPVKLRQKRRVILLALLALAALGWVLARLIGGCNGP